MRTAIEDLAPTLFKRVPKYYQFKSNSDPVRARREIADLNIETRHNEVITPLPERSKNSVYELSWNFSFSACDGPRSYSSGHLLSVGFE